MKRKLFTADLHFGHYNIIEFCDRPFDSLWEMNKGLVEMWNSCATEGDDIYVIGDLFFKAHEDLITWVLLNLNGRIKLIPGNHDKELLKYITKYCPSNVSLLPPISEITIGKRKLVLCHYPILSWHGKQRGAIHLHGHSHNKTAMDKIVNSEAQCFYRIDVGYDANKKLLGIEDIVEMIYSND